MSAVSPGSAWAPYRLHITAYGHALYEQEWARYSELYPDIEVPEPRTRTSGRMGNQVATVVNAIGELLDSMSMRPRLLIAST